MTDFEIISINITFICAATNNRSNVSVVIHLFTSIDNIEAARDRKCNFSSCGRYICLRRSLHIPYSILSGKYTNIRCTDNGFYGNVATMFFTGFRILISDIVLVFPINLALKSYIDFLSFCNAKMFRVKRCETKEALCSFHDCHKISSFLGVLYAYTW